MAQATYVPNIAHDNAEALTFFNAVLQAIATNNLGATAPTETFPGMWWVDTSGGGFVLRQRNAANNAWDRFLADFNQTEWITGTAPELAVISPLLLAGTIDGALASRVYDYQEFLVSGTWTKPAELDPNDIVRVLVVGGGGSGAANNSAGVNASGGQGGETAFCDYFASDLPASMAVVIGAGANSRSGNVNGLSGGETTFGTPSTDQTITCSGGVGGTRGSGVSGLPPVTVPGSLFLGANGDFQSSPGLTGSGGGAVNGSAGIAGGSRSFFGGHGGNSGSTGQPGFVPGGGGGSGVNVSGAGANGVVRVWCIRES